MFTERHSNEASERFDDLRNLILTAVALGFSVGVLATLTGGAIPSDWTWRLPIGVTLFVVTAFVVHRLSYRFISTTIHRSAQFDFLYSTTTGKFYPHMYLLPFWPQEWAKLAAGISSTFGPEVTIGLKENIAAAQFELGKRSRFGDQETPGLKVLHSLIEYVLLKWVTLHWTAPAARHGVPLHITSINGLLDQFKTNSVITALAGHIPATYEERAATQLDPALPVNFVLRSNRIAAGERARQRNRSHSLTLSGKYYRVELTYENVAWAPVATAKYRPFPAVGEIPVSLPLGSSLMDDFPGLVRASFFVRFETVFSRFRLLLSTEAQRHYRFMESVGDEFMEFCSQDLFLKRVSQYENRLIREELMETLDLLRAERFAKAGIADPRRRNA